MIKFMEWVRGMEIVSSLLKGVLREARGEPVDFTDLARRYVIAAQKIIDQSDVPDGVKTAAKTMDKTPQLQPHVLGDKLRGSLSKVKDGSTQEDLVSNTFLRLVQNMPRILSKEYEGKSPTAQELGNRLSALVLYDIAQFSMKQMWRDASKAPKNLTDVQDDDEERIEPSYEPKDPYASSTRPKLSRQKWNEAIKTVMTVQHNMQDEIERIEREKTGQRTQALKNTIEKLNTTLALMRNMPMEMARGVGAEGDGMTQDDNKIYHRFAKMVLDKESDLDAGDRELLSNWASQDGKVNQEHRNLIATAIWVANGMNPSNKPKKAMPDDHWFYQFADIPEEREDDEDEPMAYKPSPEKTDEPDEPDDAPGSEDYSSLFSNPTEPEPEPEPTPTKFTPPVEKKKRKKKKKDKPEQRGLFDDFDDE